MTRPRKSWLPKTGYSVPSKSEAEVSSVPVKSAIPDSPPTHGIPRVSDATGISIAAGGFDEIDGSWLNVTRRVADVNTGDNILNSKQGIPSTYLPKGLKEQIKKAQSWREDDELLESLIEIKKDFTIIGFSLQCRQSKFSKEEQDTIDQFQETLDEIMIETNFYKIVSDLLVDFYTTDNAILYWRSKPASSDIPLSITPISELLPNVYDICAINPGDCNYDDSLGVDNLYVDMPSVLYERIRFAINKLNVTDRIEAITSLIASGVGIKWIEAVKKGEKKVLLSKEDGDNWIVITKQRKHCGLKKPSMYNIFLDLQTRKMFKEGEFLGAFMMKHFIMLITQGESITQGPDAGSRKNWLSPEDAQKLINIFSNVSLAMRIAMNHTTDIKYIFPPAEMFSIDKYGSCEQRIFNWSGIIMAIMKGEGGTYSSAFIGIKKLVAHISNARRIIGEAVTNFFKHETIASSINPPAQTKIVARFDENVLKEPAQLLDEVKTLLSSGPLDPRSALFELGRDPDLVSSRKFRCISEQESDNIWSPVYEKSAFGNTQQEQNGGRPANEGTTPNEGTRTQPPSSGS